MSSVYEKSVILGHLPHLWSPYLSLAKVFGLYHLSTENEKSKINARKFYSVIVFLLMAGMFAAFISDVVLPLVLADGMSDVSLLSKNASLLASFLVAIFMIGYYFMLSHASSALQRFYQAWLHLPFKSMDIMTIEKSVRKQTKFNIIFVIVTFLVYCTRKLGFLVIMCYNCYI